MAVLPPELLEHIFVHLRDTGAIVNAMCANKVFRDIGERVLYRDLILNIRLMDTLTTRRGDILCLVSLSTSQSTPKALRHLTINGHAPNEFRSLMIAVLTRANDLLSLSLNIAFHEPSQTTDSELFIPASLSTSTHFLPRLSALDTPHFQLLEVLLPGRSLNNIRIRRSLSHSDLETLARHGLRVTAKVSQLQIQCAVDNLNACLASLTFIAQHFVNINALGMHFVLPSGNIPPWEDFEATANQILPLLHALRHLHAFSLTTTPDPVIVHDHRGERRTAGFPLVNYEKKTRELARTITESVPGLRRVELRWHGWMQQSGQWVPISQNKLMRRVWFNAEQRRVQSSKSG